MPTLQQTYSTQPHQKVLSSLERTNTHLLKILDTLILSNGGYLVIWYPLFDKKQYLYPIITRIPQHHHIRFVYHGGIQCCQINQSRFSESCPIPSLITERGICLPLATLAHEWRATYIVKGWTSPNFFPISFSLLFTKQIEFLYCNLSSFLIWIIIGSR